MPLKLVFSSSLEEFFSHETIISGQLYSMKKKRQVIFDSNSYYRTFLVLRFEPMFQQRILFRIYLATKQPGFFDFQNLGNKHPVKIEEFF